MSSSVSHLSRLVLVIVTCSFSSVVELIYLLALDHIYATLLAPLFLVIVCSSYCYLLTLIIALLCYLFPCLTAINAMHLHYLSRYTNVNAAIGYSYYW